MRIIAILAAYNEERFIAACIEHYARQGVDVYLIDHGSTDRTAAIAEEYWNNGLIGIEPFPRNGLYEWKALLERKETLAATLAGDWFIHADPDEVRLPPRDHQTLREALEDVDSEGYNAVNFTEFTFIPVREAPNHDHPDFLATMRWYYPFEPSFPHRVNAWKRQPQAVELAWSGGHRVRFGGLRLCPASFPMRHYQFLSVGHALTKYTNRQYLRSEVQEGWHGWRAHIEPDRHFQLPPKAELREYTADTKLDASNPWRRHYLADAWSAAREPATAPSTRSPATDDSRPEVLVIVNRPHWAHDYKTRNLQRILGGDYRVVKRYHSDVAPEDLDRADLVQIYYWMQRDGLQHLTDAFDRNVHKLLMGICSHIELEGEHRLRGLAMLSQARAVFVNSRLLHDEFVSLSNVPVFYTPNGVDTTWFRPATRSRSPGPLRVGWAGSLMNHGPAQRGLQDLIVPAVNAVTGVEVVTAIREDRWRSAVEMREYYQSLDIYVCASRNEGTPNPCLEAAACGVPVVTTRVGNMPELIEHGRNGFFVERDIKDIEAKLTLLRDDVDLRHAMSNAIRRSVESWDWDHQAGNFRELYRVVLRSEPPRAVAGAAPATSSNDAVRRTPL